MVGSEQDKMAKLAYEAWRELVLFLPGGAGAFLPVFVWEVLDPAMQRAWQAAAGAVIDAVHTAAAEQDAGEDL